MWLLESADRSRVRVVVASKTFNEAPINLLLETIEVDENLKTESPKERSSTELRFASFPARA
jgi:hypothetical protein